MIQSYFDRKAAAHLIPEDSPFIAAFERMHNAFSDSINKYGDYDAAFRKIARWNLKKLATTWLDVAEPMRCGFQILNHGDIWLNNMMFKSDKENHPLDVSLIDFQVPFWGSPAADILYFLLTSVADNIKVVHFDDFIEFYHEQLTLALKSLHFDQHIPTLSEIHIDLLDKGGFGMI